MALTLRYSLQDSPLKPKGITGEYARLQVDWRSEQRKITISDDDYKAIVDDLTEGRLIGLQSASGVSLGQFVTGLAGGVVVDEFTSATKGDIRISFKPTQRFLRDTRKAASFEQVPTITTSPEIIAFTYIANEGGRVQTNKINLAHKAGVITIKGTDLTKDGMTAEIVQYISDITTTTNLPTILNSGTKKMDILFSVGDTIFTKGEMTLPDYTRLYLKRISNPSKSAFINFTFYG